MKNHGNELKNLVDNKIEHDIGISTIKSQMSYVCEKRKEWETMLKFNDDWFDGCTWVIMDIQIPLMIIDLGGVPGHVWSSPEPIG